MCPPGTGSGFIVYLLIFRIIAIIRISAVVVVLFNRRLCGLRNAHWLQDMGHYLRSNSCCGGLGKWRAFWNGMDAWSIMLHMQLYTVTSYSSISRSHVLETLFACSLQLFGIQRNVLIRLNVWVWSHAMRRTGSTHNSPTPAAVVLSNECSELHGANHALLRNRVRYPDRFS